MLGGRPWDGALSRVGRLPTNTSHCSAPLPPPTLFQRQTAQGGAVGGGRASSHSSPPFSTSPHHPGEPAGVCSDVCPALPGSASHGRLTMMLCSAMSMDVCVNCLLDTLQAQTRSAEGGSMCTTRACVWWGTAGGGGQEGDMMIQGARRPPMAPAKHLKQYDAGAGATRASGVITRTLAYECVVTITA